MKIPLFNLSPGNRALGIAAVLSVLPALGFSQTPLYQWDFSSGSLVSTGSGIGGALTITNSGTAGSAVLDGSGVNGVAGDYGLDLSSTVYNSSTNKSTVVGAASGDLSAITVTMWIKSVDWAVTASSSHNSRLLLLNNVAGTDGDELYFSMNGGTGGTGTRLQVGVNAASTGALPAGAYLPTSGSDWVFVAFTWDSSRVSGGDYSVFMGDANTAASQVGTNFGPTNTSSISFSEVSIGNRPDTGNCNFDGWMDDVRIYDGALDAGQIEAIRVQAAIPEPSTYAATLGALAFAGIVGLRRRG